MNDAGATHERDFHSRHENVRARRAKAKRVTAAVFAAFSAVFLAACSTRGPGHAYLYSPALGPSIRDIHPGDGSERAGVPAYVEVGEHVLGLAYDPYTDHLFLRLAPGNHVRVIDRPAAAVKRGFIAPNLPIGGRDLAVRSRDRHLFFTDPTAPALFETDLHGKLENYLPLEGLVSPPWGLAHDPLDKELLVLAAAVSDRVHRFSEEGRALGEVLLSDPVQGLSLGFDADAREYYASLADASAIGVFDSRGRLLRRLPRPDPSRECFIDIGPRSLLRLF